MKCRFFLQESVADVITVAMDALFAQENKGTCRKLEGQITKVEKRLKHTDYLLKGAEWDHGHDVYRKECCELVKLSMFRQAEATVVDVIKKSKKGDTYVPGNPEVVQTEIAAIISAERTIDDLIPSIADWCHKAAAI